MNADIKKLWIDALKSGKYLQCTQVFKDDEYNCALGVLIELYNDVHPSEQIDIEATESFPSVVSQWAGLKSYDPEKKMYGFVDVMEMNDAGKSFTELADFIEANL